MVGVGVYWLSFCRLWDICVVVVPGVWLRLNRPAVSCSPVGTTWGPPAVIVPHRLPVRRAGARLPDALRVGSRSFVLVTTSFAVYLLSNALFIFNDIRAQ